MDGILEIAANHPELSDLPSDINRLCEVVQGLLIHDFAAQNYYGEPPPDFEIDRTTKTVSTRLDKALESHALPLWEPRAPFERQVGTCRDFAAMLCAFARHVGFEARVRCGFAGYLLNDGLEDHWIIEYRGREDNGWRFADAQMDRKHREALNVWFDIADIPKNEFTTADLAWKQWRNGLSPANEFAHGQFRGERLIFVNLVRDALARADILTSNWDRWRELGDLSLPLSREALSCGDKLSSGDNFALESLCQKDPLSYLVER